MCIFYILFYEFKTQWVNWGMLAEKRSGKTDCRNRPFAGPSHVTYPPLNLRSGTLWIPEIKKSRKNFRENISTLRRFYIMFRRKNPISYIVISKYGPRIQHLHLFWFRSSFFFGLITKTKNNYRRGFCADTPIVRCVKFDYYTQFCLHSSCHAFDSHYTLPLLTTVWSKVIVNAAWLEQKQKTHSTSVKILFSSDVIYVNTHQLNWGKPRNLFAHECKLWWLLMSCNYR